MINDWKFWVSTVTAAVLCLVVFANLRSYSANAALQSEVASRQQYVNQSIQLSRFNSQFVQLLASVAAQTHDEALRALLLNHGITFSVKPPDQKDGDVASKTDAPAAKGDKKS